MMEVVAETALPLAPEVMYPMFTVVVPVAPPEKLSVSEALLPPLDKLMNTFDPPFYTTSRPPCRLR